MKAILCLMLTLGFVGHATSGSVILVEAELDRVTAGGFNFSPLTSSQFAQARAIATCSPAGCTAFTFKSINVTFDGASAYSRSTSSF
jgi:hypothetical protein